MIKRKFFVILIFIISCCCFQNFAYGNNQAIVSLESKQETIEQGSEIEITVKLENEKMAACNFSLYFDSAKLDFISNNSMDMMGNTNLINSHINFVWFDSLRWRRCKRRRNDYF